VGNRSREFKAGVGVEIRAQSSDPEILLNTGITMRSMKKRLRKSNW
jgi:hypothetical protein